MRRRRTLSSIGVVFVQLLLANLAACQILPHAELLTLGEPESERIPALSSSETANEYQDDYLDELHSALHSELIRIESLLPKARQADDSIKLGLLRTNIERLHRLQKPAAQRYLLVNTANYSLHLVENGSVTFQSKVIVGRQERQTPELSSMMKYLVINPSWNVPHSIATKDLLPKMQQNADYLTENNYSLLQGWGKDERVVDPSDIDWGSIDADSFAYHLRQHPGSGNALGRIKFIFPNEHYVYLHDTPSQFLFAKDKRNFSSGCVRVEGALDLAEEILRDQPPWNRSEIFAAYDSGESVKVELERTLPVHLVYWTVWLEDGKFHYADDIYQRDEGALTAETLSCSYDSTG